MLAMPAAACPPPYTYGKSPAVTPSAAAVSAARTDIRPPPDSIANVRPDTPITVPDTVPRAPDSAASPAAGSASAPSSAHTMTTANRFIPWSIGERASGLKTPPESLDAPQPQECREMRTIALEEHCLTPELRELLGPQIHPYYHVHRWPPPLEKRLMDIGEGRIAEMDEHGIDVQVLSSAQPGLEHSPADKAIPVARAFNDRVAEAIAAHPTRFTGFAALPTADPNAAANELSRAVTELGFSGALVNGRTQERFLDDPFFWPMFESAEALGVPIYLHPMPPPKAVYDAYYSGFGDDVGFMLAAPAWGWHIETGLHAVRLILAGVFDRFPGLQIIIGHMGEVIPFMLTRID